MRAFSIFAFAVFVSASAHAAEPAFNRLKTWSAQGHAMTLHDLDGFYSGRCFAAKTPDRAENAMLGFYTRTVGENKGPAFPSPTPITKVVTVQAWDKSADYFDNDDAFDLRLKEYQYVVKQAWNRTGRPSDSPTLHWAIDWEGNGRADESHALVQYKDYIIETWSALLSQEYGEWGYHKAGDTLAMCYYFKKMD